MPTLQPEAHMKPSGIRGCAAPINYADFGGRATLISARVLSLPPHSLPVLASHRSGLAEQEKGSDTMFAASIASALKSSSTRPWSRDRMSEVAQLQLGMI